MAALDEQTVAREGVRWRVLRLVKSPDALGRRLERGAQRSWARLERRRDGLGRDASRGKVAAIEAGGELTQRRVAAAADRGNDLAHCNGGPFPRHFGSGEQCAGLGGAGTEVAPPEV
ncbi:unannotated protein [freshwater metagenome]|uniref:Unannotated protein n=1 Tax=freshwater metagenome TaxID=449393 RepID=A0A6J7AUA8_9ZZZZ